MRYLIFVGMIIYLTVEGIMRYLLGRLVGWLVISCFVLISGRTGALMKISHEKKVAPGS